MAATLLHNEKPKPVASRPPERTGWQHVPLSAFGLTLAAISLVDLCFAWFPLQFGVGEWEFGVVSRTFDNLALLTVGLGLLLAAAVLRGSAARLRIMGAVFVVLTLVLLGSIALYALNFPLAYRAVPEAAKSSLSRAAIRTGLFAAVYLVLYGWLCWFTWRRAGAQSGGNA